MKFKSFSYYAFVDAKKSPGVVKKIRNTLSAAEQSGLEVDEQIYNTSIKGVMGCLISILICKSEVVMIRFSDLVFPVLFFIMIVMRLKGQKIIIDVPTPRIVGLKEMNTAIANVFKRGGRKLYSYASASWVMLPANLIVQYADEGRYFSFGVIHKTIKIGNGILINDDIQMTKAIWPSTELNLIAVAQLADWHGYDRLLRALAEANKIGGFSYQINLTIVGDGEAFPSLKRLALELELKNVVFTGRLTGNDLDNVFQNSHVGVSSLGLYRKGLNEASDLKTREYMARGLSIIAAGSDPDFVRNSPFRFVISNDDGISDLLSFFKQLQHADLKKPQAICSYAKNHLSINSKLLRILSAIES